MLASDATGQRQAEEHEIRRKRDYALRHGGSVEGYEASYPCPGVMEWHDHDGAIWMAVCSVCGESIGVKIKDPAAEVKRRVDRAHFPEMFRTKVFEPTEGSAQARAMLRSWLDRWEDDKRPPAPALIGANGRGKTHLLVLVAGDLIRNRLVDVLFAPAGELVEAMRQDNDDRVARAYTCGLLILDDMAQAPTDWTAERMFELIDARYRNGLPLLLSTNAPIMEWSDAFGPRVASRLAEMTAPVVMEGPDWRQSPPGIGGSLPDACERPVDMFL